MEDVSGRIASVAQRWHRARERRHEELLKIESAEAFENLQKMLAAAHALAAERRLSRFAYSGRKPA